MRRDPKSFPKVEKAGHWFASAPDSDRLTLGIWCVSSYRRPRSRAMALTVAIYHKSRKTEQSSWRLAEIRHVRL